MYKINSFGFSGLLNAEFSALALNVQKTIIEVEAESMGLESSVLTTFNQKLKLMVDAVYNATGSPLTAQMSEADTKRNQVFRRIRLRLEMVSFCGDNSALLQCREVVETHLLKKYPTTITKMAVQQKTAVLAGFINDLTSKLNEDDLEALGIESDISALTQANNAFQSAYQARLNERNEVSSGQTAKVRAELSDLLAILFVQAEYMANSTLEANASKATASQQFIDIVNLILLDAKRRMQQRTGTGSVSVEEGEGPSGSGGNDQNGAEVPSGSGGNDHNGVEVPDDVVFPGM